MPGCVNGVRYWSCKSGPGVDTAPDEGQMRVGRRLALKILNAGKFLTALGVAPEQLPTTFEGRIQLYRSRITDRRMLVVLDGAADEAQVRPLLPSGRGSAVLITSRASLSGLDGLHTVRLGAFTPVETTTLLERIVGVKRVAAEPESVEQLAAYCAGLPLAIRIAGGRLVARPQWSAGDLARRLAEPSQRLDELRLVDLDVRARVEHIYRGLGELRRPFRQLARLNVPDFGVWAAAEVLGLREREAEDTLERLVEAGLLARVRSDPGAPRYGLHELVLLYGRERAAAEDPHPDRQAVLDRALHAWLAPAKEADTALLKGPAEPAGPAPGLRGAELLRHRAGAPASGRPLSARPWANPLGWFETEAEAMIGLFGQACESGGHRLAMELALSMGNFLALRQRRRSSSGRPAALPEQVPVV